MKYNSKFIEPAIMFLSWLLCFAIICIVGICNVFALEYENVVGYQNDITVVLVAPDYSNSPINVPIDSSLAFNQVREVIIQVDNFNFVANRNYQLELYLPQQDLGRANSYTVYASNGESCLVSYDNSTFDGEYPRWAFQCPNSTNNITIHIKNSSNQILWDDGPNGAPIFSWRYSYLRYSSTSLSGSGIVIDDIINNQNQNTQNIINNNNENTDKIINSNKETQEVIKDQFNNCRPSLNLFNFNNVSQPQADTTIEIIDNNKGIVKLRTESMYHFVAVLINDLEKNTNYTFSGKFTNSNPNMKKLWFSAGNTEKTITFINGEYSSGTAKTFNTGDNTSIIIYLYASGSVGGPNEATWYDIQLEKGNTSTTFEPYGEEICTNKLDETNNQLGNLNDNLNNSNSSGATNSAGDFFSGFTTDTFGLTSIITAPLNLIGSITSSTCSPLGLPLPYVNKTLELPCMSSIYSQYFGSFFTMYQTITYGIIAYWVIVRIFNLVKDFKNPEHDEIEVLDL